MPELMVGVKKKLDRLTFTYNKQKLELDIVDNEVDLIQIDEWITGILKSEWDKINLRNKLSGRPSRIDTL